MLDSVRMLSRMFPTIRPSKRLALSLGVVQVGAARVRGMWGCWSRSVPGQDSLFRSGLGLMQGDDDGRAVGSES